MKTQILLTGWICVFILSAKAQSMLYPMQGITSALDSASVISLSYENDFPNSTDQYYTQGISIQYSYKAPRTKSDHFRKNGIEITHLAYTPQEITDSTIRVGDRPYAATLYAKGSTTITLKSASLTQLTIGFYIGALGPAAGGEWMQRSIHRAIGSAQPEGWKYQIKNSLIIGPEVTINRRLATYRNYFTVDGTASAKLTTLKTGLTAGCMIRAGLLPISHKKFSSWIQYSPMANAIGYDATLQGGLWGTNSLYTISARELSRFVFYQNIGFHLRAGRAELVVYTCHLTKEFTGGLNHAYSGASVLYHF